ncbi:MAG TPA: class I lanthipeptide [Kouleothrix sp.]|jgi:hypothetical protein|uniref:class I lanthipeptide n=1 Tax=Kouleothrix sp. TaxID=2779161 RepID=UPI002C5A2430|nr:class I lanthipeptide [Kouleothrix sp.]
MGEDKKAKKGKKLALNKETVQELGDEQLEGVAGGALKTGGGHCKEQSLYPACPGTDSCTCQSCACPTVFCSIGCQPTVTCGCP